MANLQIIPQPTPWHLLLTIISAGEKTEVAASSSTTTTRDFVTITFRNPNSCWFYDPTLCHMMTMQFPPLPLHPRPPPSHQVRRVAWNNLKNRIMNLMEFPPLVSHASSNNQFPVPTRHAHIPGQINHVHFQRTLVLLIRMTPQPADDLFRLHGALIGIRFEISSHFPGCGCIIMQDTR